MNLSGKRGSVLTCFRSIRRRSRSRGRRSTAQSVKRRRSGASFPMPNCIKKRRKCKKSSWNQTSLQMAKLHITSKGDQRFISPRNHSVPVPVICVHTVPGSNIPSCHVPPHSAFSRTPSTHPRPAIFVTFHRRSKPQVLKP